MEGQTFLKKGVSQKMLIIIDPALFSSFFLFCLLHGCNGQTFRRTHEPIRWMETYGEARTGLKRNADGSKKECVGVFVNA